MKASSLTSPSRLEITDPDVAALFIKEHVAAYLSQFIGAEITIAKAANQTNVKLNVMAYWAGRFLKLGLIRVTKTETRGGSAIKHYQSVTNEFIVPVHLFENMTGDVLLKHIQQRDYNHFSHNVANVGLKLTEDWQLRLFRSPTGFGLHLEPVFQEMPKVIPRRPLHDFAEIAMPTAQAAQFYSELEALFERFRLTKHFDAELPRFIMHVGFVEVTG